MSSLFFLLLLTPQLLLGRMTVDRQSMEVGEKIEIILQGEAASKELILSQIPSPFFLHGTEVRGEDLVLQLTTWTPGRHPISFILLEKEEPYYSDVYGIEVAAPAKPLDIETKEYLQRLLPVIGAKDSLLSKVNRELLENKERLILEEAEKRETDLYSKKLPLMLLALLVALLGIAYLFKRYYKGSAEIQTPPIDPMEEALKALRHLITKALPARGEFNAYYVELTFIVRRFIERQYELRAKEQTTEEFLVCVSSHPRFNESMREQLSRFLSSADLVKFARHNPEPSDCSAALKAAERFISTHPQ
jgi:hypothetical protein